MTFMYRHFAALLILLSLVTPVTATQLGNIPSTEEMEEFCQDAVGAMLNATLVYTDATPALGRAALTGDVTASAGSNATTIANDAVTYAKIQNVSATDRLLGRVSASAGDIEEIEITDFVQSILNDTDAATVRTTIGAVGTATTLTIAGTSNEISSSAGAQDLSANRTWTLSLPATIDLGGKTSLEVPNSAAPTVDADGELAVDTTVADFSHGVMKYYSGEELAVIAVPIAQLSSPTNGYVIKYNSTADEFQLAADATGGGGLSDGDYGDITVSSSATVFTIDDDVVTYAKMQNVSATDRLLGRVSASAGNVEEIEITDFVQTILNDADASTVRSTIGAAASATTVTVAGTTNEITSSAGAQDLSANRTWTLSLPATIDLGGKTSLELPNDAAPTVDADGEIAVDTTVTDFSHGILKYYSGEELAVISVPIAQLSSPTNGHVIKYNSTADEFQLAADSAGGLSDADYGDITVGSSGTTMTIDNNVVTYAKMQQTNGPMLVGRGTSGTGNLTSISVDNTTLGLGASNILSRAAITGEVDIPAASNTATIVGDSVTFAKMQNVATATIIGRAGASTGDMQALTVGTGLAFPTSTSVDVSSTVVKEDQANTYTTGAQDFGSATSLIVPKAAGAAPTADGDIRYDTTQDVMKVGGAGGTTGALPRVLTVNRVNSQLTNNSTSDQDFTTIYTFAANQVVTGRVFRLTCLIQYVTDGAASSRAYYLKLGSTKIFTQTGAVTPGNSVTRSFILHAYIFGKDAAGASAEVEGSIDVLYGLNNMHNSTSQPVASIATNGTLALTLGLAFGTNTTGESETLLHAVLEELSDGD